MNQVSLFTCFLLITAPLCASTAPEAGSVSSTNASYDGTSLVLTGHVVLDHGLGKMTAEEASLQRQEEAAKDFPFAVIQLKKDVLLALKNNSQLRCEHADLDFSGLKGVLLPKEGERVAFVDSFKRKKSSESTPLQMLSRTLDLTFSKQDLDEKKPGYEIDTIVANRDVDITYADVSLNAGRALYRKQGTITAFPSDVASKCHLTQEKSVIDSDSVHLDLIHSEMTLLHPQGVIPSLNQKGEMHFRAEELLWNHLKHMLTLKKQVQIEDEALGTLVSQEKIELTQGIVNDQRVIQSIHATGPTSLTYHSPDGQEHKILCPGDIHLDRDKLVATLEAAGGEQIYYEEQSIAFYADKASVEYAYQEEALKPVSLTLKGNVRLFSREAGKQRCGLADRLNYSLETKTLILSANPNKKVLFSDPTQGMRISAREVHITQDPESREQVVKGVGSVQLTFNAEEQALLQQLFPEISP